MALSDNSWLSTRNRVPNKEKADGFSKASSENGPLYKKSLDLVISHIAIANILKGYHSYKKYNKIKAESQLGWAIES